MHIGPADELEWNVRNRNWSGEEMTVMNKTNYVIINFEKYLMAIVRVCAHGTNVYFVGHFYVCVVEFVGEYLCIFIMGIIRKVLLVFSSAHRLRYL